MRPNPAYNVALKKVAKAARTRVKHSKYDSFIEVQLGDMRIRLSSEIDSRFAHVQPWSIVATEAKAKGK